MFFIVNSYPCYTGHGHKGKNPVIVKELLTEHVFKIVHTYEDHLKIFFHILSDQYQ